MAQLIRLEGVFPTINNLAGNTYQFDGMLAGDQVVEFSTYYRLLGVTMNLKMVDSGSIFNGFVPDKWRAQFSFTKGGDAFSPYVEGGSSWTAVALTNDVPALNLQDQNITLNGLSWINFVISGIWNDVPALNRTGYAELILSVEPSVSSL